MNGDGAVDPGVDGVVFAQHVAHGHAHHLAQVSAFEIEQDVFGAAGRRCGGGRLDEHACAGYDFHHVRVIFYQSCGVVCLGAQRRQHWLYIRNLHAGLDGRLQGATCKNGWQATDHRLYQLFERMFLLHREGFLNFAVTTGDSYLFRGR